MHLLSTTEYSYNKLPFRTSNVYYLKFRTHLETFLTIVAYITILSFGKPKNQSVFFEIENSLQPKSYYVKTLGKTLKDAELKPTDFLLSN